MALPVNDRDVLILNAGTRDADPRAGKYIVLTATPNIFPVNSSNVSSVSSTTLSVQLVGLTNAATWSTGAGYTLTGSTANLRTLTFANMTADYVEITATVTEDGQTYTSKVGISKVKDGQSGTGTEGPAGTQFSTSNLYKWSTASSEALPTGTATFTWASNANTSYAGTDGWYTTVPANPGTTGAKLFIAAKPISAAGGTATTSVTFASGATVAAYTQNGAQGPAGAKTATVRAFKWENGAAPTATGSATYTYSTGLYDNVPATSWTKVRGNAPAVGYTLYEATVNLVETTGALTSSVDWSTAAITPIGYHGTNGSPGATGDAAMIAYVKVTGSSLNSTPATVETTGKTKPALGDWGTTNAWQDTPPTTAANESVFQSNGIYNSVTNKTTWGLPYLSSWRVGSLSAIAANLGTITGGAINIGTGTTSWHVDSNGNMWAGNAVFGSAPFRVSNTGTATFSSIAITGGTLDVGSGAASWHVDNVGNMWAGAATYAAAPFRVSNAGAVVMSSVNIINSSGQTVLSSGTPLAQQVGGAPNLAPRLSAWQRWPNDSMSWIYLDPLGRTSNGEMAIFEAGDASLYIGRDSPTLPLRANDWVTVSFMIVSNADGSTFNCDIYGDNGAGGYVDTAGKTGFPVLNNVPTRIVFTEQLPSQVGNVRLRLWKANNVGQIGVWDVKVAKGKVDTPYSEDVITPGNAGALIMPNSIGNTQIGGNLYSTNWNGIAGAGGTGWLLDRGGNIYLNSATVRGTVSSSLIESSALRLNSARLLSLRDRLCPFSIRDCNTQLWTSGSGYCEIQLTGFIGPSVGTAWSYHPKRLTEWKKDVFLKVTVAGSGYPQIVIGVMYNNDGNWNWIVSTGVDLAGNASRAFAIRYTTTEWEWSDMKFAAWTQSGAAQNLTFELEIDNVTSSSFGAHTNSGIATSTPPPPPPPPPYEEPEPYCVDYETARFTDGTYARDCVVGKLVEIWNDDPIIPGTELVPALSVRFGYEESYRIRSESGAELLQSKSTPMTLRDGSVIYTPALLGEEVLVKRGNTFEWERCVSLENIGVRKVVKLAFGDRTFFAGTNPDATIATHNLQQYKP